MPQVFHQQTWFKKHPFQAWGVLVLFLSVAVVAVTVLSGISWTKKSAPLGPAQKAVKLTEIQVNKPTAEEIQAAKNMVRADGKVSAMTATTITFIPTGKSKSVTIKLTDVTLYSVGSISQTADRASIKPGQLVIVAYDSSTSTAKSVWGGYNQ